MGHAGAARRECDGGVGFGIRCELGKGPAQSIDQNRE